MRILARSWRRLSVLALLAALEPSRAFAQGLNVPADLPIWGAKVKAEGASPLGAAPRSEKTVSARSLRITGDADTTKFVLELDGTIEFSAFRLSHPDRVVVDLTEVQFLLPADTGRRGHGLIKAFRFGQFAQGKSRIVIDVQGTPRISSSRLVETTDGKAARLEIDLVRDAPSKVAAAELAAAMEGFDGKAGEQPSQPKPPSRGKPMIVIDPGHGGIDPGAQGAHVSEKDIVLSVSQEVRRALQKSGRYEVVLTRASDVFLTLDQRIRLSRKMNADLFLSVHADSLAARDLAQNVRGATIYTLAEKASDDQSRARAEKENAADLLAGVVAADIKEDEQVSSILVDLMRRETSNFSNEFRKTLVRQMKSRVALAREPMRSAPFKVLRQPGSPAVLVELGYISNAEDERLMASAAWQRTLGEGVANAVDEYFSKVRVGGK